MTIDRDTRKLLDVLRSILGKPARRYKELNAARNFAEYLSRPVGREDEEILTEPILADLLERLLDFPPDAYFPQYGRSGLKPDLTPHDLVAHRFVLDAKSSAQTDLDAHERQIRAYIDQRQLDYGVLFNLRELRVYRRGERGHDAHLSFQLLPLWQVARSEALPDSNVGRLRAFRKEFQYRVVGTQEKIRLIRAAEPWSERTGRGDVIELDIDFLVDRLRELSGTLSEDAAAQHEELANHLKLSPARERALLGELEALALDISPGIDLDTLPDNIDGYRTGEGIASRVWRQYLLRVSQLALTRIMLYRSWEDVGFVQDYLYDGGFGQVYDRLGKNVREVLNEAFLRGQTQYRWLYGGDNNYDWFRPREEALVDVLYALVPVPLGKLDADVLGGLYESYVDEIDRDRLGQFYTPRSVVRFMLDRAGFSGPDGVFRLEGDSRKPRRVFDFATGSGGFLVEGARRIIDEGGIDPKDGGGLIESLASIVNGFAGCEISPFPYYLTEINLLLQVSRLIGRIRHADESPSNFVLGVVHADTLTTRPGPDESLEGVEPGSRLDRAELIEDERYGLVPLDAEKREAFRRMRENEAFDLVVGNPPYVFESNNRVLFERLRGLPGWNSIYRGKSDYLYYFLYLAAEKVALGGRLCVITPAGWMNAGNADWLREKIAGTLRLDELFLFGSYRLFAPERERRGARHRAPTPTVESAILLATKAATPKSHKLRVVALEDEVEVAAALSGDPETRMPDRDALLAEMGRRADARGGRSKGLHVHSVRQSDLISDRPWPIKHGSRDVAARVVAHLQAALDAPDAPVERVADRWHVIRGIETAADAYTARIQKRLPADVKSRLTAEGLRTGDPILELPAGRERQDPWRTHPDVLARSPEPSALLYGVIDDSDYTNLIWLGRDDDAPERVIAALDQWRPVLASRAGFAGTDRRWWETHRPRNKAILRAPKVIALYRTDRGRFALDETGEWQPSNKATIAVSRDGDLSVAYLCALLNSELLDLWFAVRGKTPRDVWRNYEPKAMNEIPYRHVHSDAKVTDRLKRLAEAIEQRDWDAVGNFIDEVGGGIADDESAAVEAKTALEQIVHAIAANRRALLPYRELAPGLERIVKDPWRSRPVSLDEASVIETLPLADRVSVRVDPSLAANVSTDGAVGRAHLDSGALIFNHAKRTTVRIEGPKDRLALLARLVEARARLLPAGLLAITLPRDLARLEQELSKQKAEITDLLDDGRALVEAAERIVCRVYAVPRDLEDAVVAHALNRAGSDQPGD